MTSNFRHKEGKKMQYAIVLARQTTLVILSVLLLVMATVPDFMLGKAYAGQPQFRSITMDSSTPGVATTYTVSFKPTVTSNIGGIVVDFCDDSPLVLTSTCTLPPSFTLGSAAPTVTTITGIPNSGWVTTNSLQGAAAASNFQVLKLTNPTPQTPTGTGTAITFKITSVTNPNDTCSTSTACTFYARIVTFDTSANAVSNYTATTTARATTINNTIDSGGVALSLATSMSITARVMETLSFCVYASSCGDSPSAQIGTGTPPAIDANSVYTSNILFSLSTNATNPSTVYLFGGTLTSGSNTIAAKTTAGTITAGTAAFGVKFTTLGSVSAAGSYGTSNYYLGAAAGTAPGEAFATTSGPVNNSVTTFTYGATTSNTTPAGVYTATHRLVAVGSF